MYGGWPFVPYSQTEESKHDERIKKAMRRVQNEISAMTLDAAMRLTDEGIIRRGVKHYLDVAAEEEDEGV